MSPHSKRRRLITPSNSNIQKKRNRSAPNETAATSLRSRRSATSATQHSKTEELRNTRPNSAHHRKEAKREAEKPEEEREATEVKSTNSLQKKNKNERPKTAAIMTGSSWNYDDDGECGPHKWPMAVDGTRQSPIDLRLSKMNVITLQEPLQFVNYDQPLHGEYVNTGHSVPAKLQHELNLMSGVSVQFLPSTQSSLPEIYGGLLDQHYRFVQYHYHWAQQDLEGSEHAICGLRYPAELHLVHQGVDDPAKLAVLGIFLNRGDGDSRALGPDAEVFAQLTESGQRAAAKSAVNLSEKLPECKTSFVRYEGSLTTPPCSENVTWTIFTDPIDITPKQLELMRSIKDHSGSIIRKNCRPLQRLNNRTVFFARS
ncbi:Alpha carbonic anhydrase domain-containing protein [Aphelenchoides besseyi]|nr:Alpha carbonic anhydrase domain-containing protein [Aphelenchoides besseyi]